MRPIALAFLLLALAFPVRGEEAPRDKALKFRAQGMAALKAADDDPKALVQAAEAFAQASDLYADLKMEAEATEMNSYLFWCRKKMNLEQIEAYTKKGATAENVVRKMDAVVNLKVDETQAQRWFDRAEQFVLDNPEDHFGAAVRFFEVANRFKGSEVGMKATDRTLQEMQKIKAAKDAAAGSKDSAALGMAPETFMKKAKAAYEAAVQKARTEFEAAERMARSEYLASLERAATEVTKAGNLKLANQANEEREAYALSARIPKLSPFASDPFTSRFIGAWMVGKPGESGQLMVIDAAGTVYVSWDPKNAGCLSRQGNLLLGHFTKGHVWELKLHSDGTKSTCSSWNPGKWTETGRVPQDLMLEMVKLGQP